MSRVFSHSSGFNEAALAELEALSGKELRIEQYNHEATYDTIRHYAFGIGDDNPLWCDADYAAQGPHKTMVAPPTFFYSVFAPGIAPGLPGLQPFQAGGDCTWHRLPHRGEEIRAKARFVGFELAEGRVAGPMVIEHGEVSYRTAEGELLASFKSKSYRVPRQESGEGLRYEPLEEYEYSKAELEEIEEAIFSEYRRGESVFYWEDVSVGDEIVPVVKGPLDRITMTVYYAGALATSGYKASELRWKQWRIARDFPEELPNNYDETYFAERVLPSLGHQDSGVAQALGMPGAYDNGHQRMGWVAHAVTNWMGDRGFLARLTTRIRRPNIFGNTTWIHGRVAEKTAWEGKPAVKLELWGVDQRGTKNTTAEATVVLPSSP